MLGFFLLARPANASLRAAIGQVYPDALTVVPEIRFKLEALIASQLNSAQTATLRTSLERIDTLTAAVTAYKAMHDSLHMLQPLLPVMRKIVDDRPNWSYFGSNVQSFQQQLNAIDAAGKKLAAVGVPPALDFRDAISSALASLTNAVTAGQDYDVADAVSQLASSVEDGLSSVDVSMLNAARNANQPFAMALDFFVPLAKSAAGSSFEGLIDSFIDFARDVSKKLDSAITEHGRWQKLDRQLDLLQRAVVYNLPSAPGEIDTVWRLASSSLTELCGGAPPPDWATAIVDLLGQATNDLKRPISPPVAAAVSDRISNLVANGRNRFMAVDQSLLNWLEDSASKRPELVALLMGEVPADA